MSSQAAQFATTFDRLGRRMLAQLESLPEGLWDWAPPILHCDSLLTLATRLLEESEYWVLVTIGGQEMWGEHSLEASSPDVRATLLQRYERWGTEMQRVLGHLPDAIMNLFVAVPPSYRETFGAESITVRVCSMPWNRVASWSGASSVSVKCLLRVNASSTRSSPRARSTGDPKCANATRGTTSQFLWMTVLFCRALSASVPLDP